MNILYLYHKQIIQKLFTVIIACCLVVPGYQSFSQCTPVASFPFNGNANDISGNNNHGIPGGQSTTPVLTTDRFGNPNSAYQFGGFYNKNWIQVPNSPSLTFQSEMSVAMWFKQCAFDGMDPNGNYSSNGVFALFSKAGDGIAARPGFWSMSSTNLSNELQVSFSNTNSSALLSVNFNDVSTFDCFDTCEWVHMTVVIDSTDWKMYFNGKLSRQTTINPADFTAANNEDFWIGRMFGSPLIWYPFNGVIDDVSIYNCALTQSEIDALYNNYSDPLAGNNNITIDSIQIVNPGCSSSQGSITVFTNDIANQYSINSGLSFQATNAFNNLDTGTYTIIIRSFCTEIDTTITIMNYQNLTSLNPAICNGNFFQLPGGSNTNIPGLYSDTLVSSSGCDSIVEINLTVYPPISFSIVTSPANCNMDNGVAGVSVSSGLNPLQFYWPHGISNDSAVENLSPGNHTVLVYDSAGCFLEETFTVGYIPSLTIDAEVKDATCGLDNGEIKIISSGGIGPFNYNWSPNVGASTLVNNLSDGTFILTATDSTGCSVVDTITISRIPGMEVSVFVADDTCSRNLGSASINIVSGSGPFNFLWLPGGETLQLIDSLSHGEYSVIVTDSAGCTFSSPVKIQNTGNLSISLGEDKTICPGVSIKLSPGNYFSYQWHDHSTSPAVDIAAPGIYWVQVADQHGCIAQDTIVITESCFDDLLFPNSFTPNGDGINDYFLPVGNNVSEYRLQIFNRWGEMIFESMDEKFGWDGYYNGALTKKVV